ncbi:MAG: hypothetical protein JRG84_13795 [Deltaproteobacteria bacterium]|nr:hypothetical protein [Deltaproteobacteria bacterium]
MAGVRRQPPRACAAALVVWLVLLPAAHAADPGVAGTVDLAGAWHVLVHYTDDNSSHPDQLRWHDRVWVFERKNGKLVWTEYPIVVFGDDAGRFERRSSGQYARVLGGWWPSEAQLANIRVGLRTNTRGMKSKKLRGSDAEGWATHSRVRAASASVISYQENWSVTYEAGLPHFQQQDVMGSARTESLEGITRYETRESAAGGAFAGAYERDGTRHGTFWMRRAGARLRLDAKDPKRQRSEVPRRGGSQAEPVLGEGEVD